VRLRSKPEGVEWAWRGCDSDLHWSDVGEAERLRDEGGDGPQAIREDDCADDCNEDGEDPLHVRYRQDVPVAHCAATHGTF
jgi:hypothetical protein